MHYSAGRGTNGGDGGDGGTINVFVDEDETHLLLATLWETRPGEGGPAGRHGDPGRGGRGGRGGAGCKWSVALHSSAHFLLRTHLRTELVGYKYYCTDNCVGRESQTSMSRALVATGSQVGNGTYIHAHPSYYRLVT